MTKKIIIAIIPARGGSKGIKLKNLKKINGKSLIEILAKQIKKCNFINYAAISTDNIKIAAEGNRFGLDVISRPKNLSGDKISDTKVLLHGLLKMESIKNKKFDIAVMLHPTSPLRKIDDIKEAFRKFKSSKQDMLISGNKARKNPYFNMVQKKGKNSLKLTIKPKKFIVRTQDAPTVYELNASIYFWKRESCFRQKGPFCKKTFFYEMPYSRSIDIDSLSDFKMVEFFGKNND